MNIVEELRAAHMRYLQDEWDKWLLHGWHQGSTITAFAARAFITRYKITYDTLNQLRRTPLYGHQSKSLLTRFIAAYLPDLSTLLWADKHSDEQILKAMKHMDTLKNPSDAHKSKQENSARRKAQKEANAETTSHRMVKEQRAYTSKSNWNHCK